MPTTILMAATKFSPVLPSSSKPSSSSSSSLSLLTSTSTTTSSAASSGATSVSTISIPVSAFHDPNSNMITLTPYIFLKTATVAEQMSALRADKKLAQPPDQPTGALRVKRRSDLSKLGLPDAKPASVSRRNARERNRVKQVNLGFETLREHVPNGKKNKKMSKVQTLRSAAQYIKDLYMILHGELPALSSPTVLDDNDAGSPLDNSLCSMSDNDNENSVGSPDSHIQQQSQQQQQQQVSVQAAIVPTSPTSSALSSQLQQQQQQHQQVQQLQQRLKQQPLILKKDTMHALEQQVSASHAPQLTLVSALLQQRQEARQQQVQQQQQQQHESQQQQQQQKPQQQQQLLQLQSQPTFDPSALRLDPLTCTPHHVISDTGSTSVPTSDSALTFTELSPVSLVDEQCDSCVELPPGTHPRFFTDTTATTSTSGTITTTDSSSGGGMDGHTSPSILHTFMNDVNMNVVEAVTDFDGLHSYYKSMRAEQFKQADSSFLLDPPRNNSNNTDSSINMCNNNSNRLVSLNHNDSSISLNNNNSLSFLLPQKMGISPSSGSSLCSSPATSSSGDMDSYSVVGGGRDTDSYSVEGGAVTCDYEQYDNLDTEALMDISKWISELCSQGMHVNDINHSLPAPMAFSH